MDEELLFRLLFIAIYAVFFGVRIRYRVNSIKREPEQRQKTTSWHIKILIAAIIGYFVSIALYLLNLQWFQWSQIGLPTWLRWMGAFGAVFSIILVAWTHRVLGKQYSAELAIQKNHVLVTTGPYYRTRHPMYTALNAFSFSMALMTSNLLNLLFAVFVFLPFPWIAREEERMLLETFGEEYKEYMKRTGRFFPRI
jgi:protein-S-isoprenylcysteine O-methyltransferase Ste14